MNYELALKHSDGDGDGDGVWNCGMGSSMSWHICGKEGGKVEHDQGLVTLKLNVSAMFAAIAMNIVQHCLPGFMHRSRQLNHQADNPTPKALLNAHQFWLILHFRAISSPSARRQTWHITIPLISFCLEHDLTPKLFRVGIPPCPEAVLPPVDLPRLQLKTTSLVRLCRHQQELVVLVGVLDLLLKRTHEPDSGLHTRRDLRVMELKQQAHLPRERIPRLCDLVPRPTDLDHVLLHLHTIAHHHLSILLRFFLFPCCAPGQVGLMFSSLRVGEVGAIVLVHRQAETAFEGSDVVLEEVRVFVEIDALEGEFAKTFAAICVCCGL